MLHAVGIESEVAWDGSTPGSCWTRAADESAARVQLQRYERENPPRRRARAAGAAARRRPGSARSATQRSCCWSRYLAGRRAFAADWLSAGGLAPRPRARANSGAPSRPSRCTSTSPTCWATSASACSSAGWPASCSGPASPGPAALAAAAAANLLNAFVQPASHLSVGASTAVFATLGLLSAYAWRRRAGAGRPLGVSLGPAGRGRVPARLHGRRRRKHRRARAPDRVS